MLNAEAEEIHADSRVYCAEIKSKITD